MNPAARDRRRTAVPIFSVTAVAWIVLAVRARASSGPSPGSCCLPASFSDAISPESLKLLLVSNPPSVLLMGWALMLVAMMTPMLAMPIRHVMDRSFAKRRLRAVLLFLLGYLGVWMLAGVVILTLVLVIRLMTANDLLRIGSVTVLAAVWQCSPAKQRSLNRAHSNVELAAFGWAADWDVLRYGLTHGFWCVGSCWALMWLSEMFAVGHITAMAAVTIWVLAEHLERHTAPRWRLRGIGRATRLVIPQTRNFLSAGLALNPFTRQ